MNEQLKTQLSQFLGSILTGLEKGAGFVIEQAPDVVREYVLLCRVEYTFYVVTSLLLILAAIKWVPVLADRAVKVENEIEEVTCGITAAVLGGSGLISIFVFLHSISPMLKAWFAPRILVIEWIKIMVQ